MGEMGGRTLLWLGEARLSGDRVHVGSLCSVLFTLKESSGSRAVLFAAERGVLLSL